MNNKELLQEIARAQEKLRAIDKLSNYLQKIDDTGIKHDIAHLIHRIIEADYLSSQLSHEVTGYAIEANKDMFVSL